MIKDNEEALLFNQIDVTPDEICDAAICYLGLPYSQVTHIVHEENGSVKGSANCFGILLQAAKDKGLYPADFDVNLAPSTFGGRVEKTLWSIIHANFHEVPIEDMKHGDIPLMKYWDMNPKLRTEHHVSIIVPPSPGSWKEPSTVNYFLHADENHGVVRAPINELVQNRIMSLWRMNNYSL